MTQLTYTGMTNERQVVKRHVKQVGEITEGIMEQDGNDTNKGN